MIKINDKEYITGLEYIALPDNEKHNWSIQSLWAYKLKTPDNKHQLYISYDEYDTLTKTEKALYKEFFCDYYLLVDMDNKGKYKPQITEREYKALSDSDKELYQSDEYYYYDPEIEQDNIPIKDIYYKDKPKGLLNSDTLELHFTLNDSDKEDNRNKPYISAFYRLQEILDKIVIEYNKEYLYYKQITKIANKVKAIFTLQESYKSLETIDFIKAFNTFSINLSYNIYEYDKRQSKTEYKRYYDIGLDIIFNNLMIDISTQEPIQSDDFNTDEIIYTIEYFTSKKEFTTFKKKVKDIYTDCEKLLRLLIFENENKHQQIKTTSITHQTTAIIKNNLPYMTTPEYKTYTRIYDKKLDRKVRHEINIKLSNKALTPQAYKLMVYIQSKYNTVENTTTINLNEYAHYKNISMENMYKFYYHIYELIDKELMQKININIINTETKETVEQYTFTLFSLHRKANILNIVWNKQYQNYINNNLISNQFLTKIFALKDTDEITQKLSIYLLDLINMGFSKTIHKKGITTIEYKNQHKDKIGTYNIISIKSIVEHLGFTSGYRIIDIITKIENSLNKLYKEGIIKDYEFVANSKGLELSKDITNYKPSEKMDLYLKYYVD